MRLTDGGKGGQASLRGKRRPVGGGEGGGGQEETQLVVLEGQLADRSHASPGSEEKKGRFQLNICFAAVLPLRFYSNAQ